MAKEGRPENLRKNVGWQPGKSGNPYGRPSRMTTLVTNALREKLAAFDPETKQTFAERIAMLLIKCAIEPDPELDKTRIQALSEIIDRCEGKPKQQLDVNDVTAELRARSDEDLMFHLERGYWPEDEAAEKRKQLMLAAAKRAQSTQ